MIEETLKKEREDIDEMLRAGVGPADMAEKLIRLSSLFSSFCAYLTEADIEYRKVKARILEKSNSVARARSFAEATPEFGKYISLLNQKEALLELIRSVKYYLKSSVEDYSNTK